MGCIFETTLLYVGTLAVCVLAVVYAYFKVSFGNVAEDSSFRKPIGHVHEELYKKFEGEK